MSHLFKIVGSFLIFTFTR